ncbi:MAG: hypothetical protein ACXWV5_04670 [Flavitalea sp.]
MLTDQIDTVPLIYPSVQQINDIVLSNNLINRNLQITQSYSELSNAMSRRTGQTSNWCTFATWASKQAGVTIRGEDLRRKLLEELSNDPEIKSLLNLLLIYARQSGTGTANNIHLIALQKMIATAQQNAGDAVSRGNKKVFEEIGKEFARFIATCLNDEKYDESSITNFRKDLRQGQPPSGQDYLAKAFTYYYRAIFETDIKSRQELFLLANILIGYHEQARLQPEIAESMNAAKIDAEKLKLHLTDILVRDKTAKGKVTYFFSWLSGKTNLFKRAVDSLVVHAESKMRKVITKNLMTLYLPPDTTLELGDDLLLPYPGNLRQLSNPVLLDFLKQVKPSLETIDGAGCTDWSNLRQRIHYIANLFRCYHESADLFSPPFTNEQVVVIKKGGIPDGFL